MRSKSINRILILFSAILVGLILMIQVRPASAELVLAKDAADYCTKTGANLDKLSYESCLSRINIALDDCTGLTGLNTPTEVRNCKENVLTYDDGAANNGAAGGGAAGGGEITRKLDNDPLLTDCEEEPGGSLDRTNCKIIDYLVIGINFLSAVAGMAIVASIMMAGYQYTTARDNASQVQAARQRIIWALIALFVMIFMYAFLNWVVPGGVL